MKNFLAVDTGAKYMTVVARVDGKIYTRYEENCAMRHSVLLMEAIDGVLKEAGATIQDFDYFACVVGAGSFTGIRIGISTIKGFALATGKKTMPITSFELLAYTTKEEKLLALSDALHGAFYASAYENGVQTLAPCYQTEEELRVWAEKGYTPVALEKTAFLGEEIKTVSPAEALVNATIAKEEKGEFGELLALYIRKSQAEINLERGELVL